MPETAKTVTETVVNKNTVKLALTEYNELVAKAARPIVNNVTLLKMTNKQVAENNVMYGALIAGLGGAMLVGGVIINRLGKKALK